MATERSLHWFIVSFIVGSLEYIFYVYLQLELHTIDNNKNNLKHCQTGTETLHISYRVGYLSKKHERINYDVGKMACIWMY